MLRYIKFLSFFLVVYLFSCVAGEAFLIQGTNKDINVFPTSVKGVAFFPLMQICEANGVSYAWDSITYRVRLYKKGQQLTFMVNEPIIDLNGKIQGISHPVCMINGAVMVPRSVLDLPWWGMTKKQEPEVAVRKPETKRFLIQTIMLDPGHGGKDQGAIGRNGLKEKDLVLSVCHELKNELAKRDISVLLTRDQDTYLSLSDRVKLTNQTNADLFISIHANGHRSNRAHGFEVYYLSDKVSDATRAVEMIENTNGDKRVEGILPAKYTNNPTLWDIALSEHRREAGELARKINSSVEGEKIIRNRGVKGSQFFVLRWVDKPSILIELGFLTNNNEESNLKNPVYKRKIIQALVRGILEYKKQYEKKYNV